MSPIKNEVKTKATIAIALCGITTAAALGVFVFRSPILASTDSFGTMPPGYTDSSPFTGAISFDAPADTTLTSATPATPAQTPGTQAPVTNLNLDSDKDGLTDWQEVNVYHTDPNKADTDGDGFTDGVEVSNGYNPNGAGKLALSATDISASQKNTDKVLTKKMSGMILLQVENHGEAWYVNPSDGKRYFVKDGNAAYQLMQKFGVGITNGNLSKIPIGTMSP